MENIDKVRGRASSPLIYDDKYPSCISEEDSNYVIDPPVPASSLPANLGPLRASFEETTFEFGKVSGDNNEVTVSSKNCFDVSFERANENNRRYSPRLLQVSKSSESSDVDSSREVLTCPVESSINQRSRQPTHQTSQRRHPVLATQVSFCQAPPVEHEYPPPAPRRHFSFGARTEQQRAQSHHHSRRNRFSRQKTVSGDSTMSTPGSANHAQHVFARALSRTYTIGGSSNPLTPTSSVATEEWRPIFEKLLEGAPPQIGTGKSAETIPLDRFREILEDDPLWSETIPKEMQERILSSVDKDGDGAIDYEEFLDLVRGDNGFFGRRQRQAFRQLLKQTVEFIVPYKYSYQNQYSCSPPPAFMLSISLLQAVVFVYNCVMFYKLTGEVGLNGPVPHCSHLIFNPDKRYQVWRYLTYMMIHSGVFHAVFNILVQLVLGIPLEMVHGWWRVMLVYLFGVLSGSLWTNVYNPRVFLSGASGGVYALITAHLGTVIMNFREMTCPWCRVFIVIVVAVTDVAVYIYNMHVVGTASGAQPVSYAAHLAGAITGLLVGITCLKNLRWETHERYVWAVSATIFILLIGSAVVFSVAYPSWFVGVPELYEELLKNCTIQNLL